LACNFWSINPLEPSILFPSLPVMLWIWRETPVSRLRIPFVLSHGKCCQWRHPHATSSSPTPQQSSPPWQH
jgi:hypothetical protein